MKKIILILCLTVFAFAQAEINAKELKKPKKDCECYLDAQINYRVSDNYAPLVSGYGSKYDTTAIVKAYNGKNLDFGDASLQGVGGDSYILNCWLHISKKIEKPKILKTAILKSRCKKWSDPKNKQAKIDIQQCVDDVTKTLPGGELRDLNNYNYKTKESLDDGYPYVKNDAQVQQGVDCGELEDEGSMVN